MKMIISITLPLTAGRFGGKPGTKNVPLLSQKTGKLNVKMVESLPLPLEGITRPLQRDGVELTVIDRQCGI